MAKKSGGVKPPLQAVGRGSPTTPAGRTHARITAVDPWLIGAPAIAGAIGGGTAYAAFYPRSELFGRHIHDTSSAKKLAITFDDGPNPAITPKLLDLLEQYQARATFFVIGRFVRQEPGLLREMAARGHAIGNHTETHPNLFWHSLSFIREQLERSNHAISEAISAGPKWFRPPYGLRNPWVIPEVNRQGMQAVMWTLICYDWKAPSSEWLIPKIKPITDRARRNSDGKGLFRTDAPGEILCLHDGNHAQQNGDRQPTLDALAYWLPRWRDLGLHFVTMDEAVK
jgi:peptidoglycan-N-acetylglucosamine deacetylase